MHGHVGRQLSVSLWCAVCLMTYLLIGLEIFARPLLVVPRPFLPVPSSVTEVLWRGMNCIAWTSSQLHQRLSTVILFWVRVPVCINHENDVSKVGVMELFNVVGLGDA